MSKYLRFTEDGAGKITVHAGAQTVGTIKPKYTRGVGISTDSGPRFVRRSAGRRNNALACGVVTFIGCMM